MISMIFKCKCTVFHRNLYTLEATTHQEIALRSVLPPWKMGNTVRYDLKYKNHIEQPCKQFIDLHISPVQIIQIDHRLVI